MNAKGLDQHSYALIVGAHPSGILPEQFLGLRNGVPQAHRRCRLADVDAAKRGCRLSQGTPLVFGGDSSSAADTSAPLKGAAIRRLSAPCVV
ncbi:hypothetical protein GCM10007856_02750 [Azospirillum oryzae]|nr:hypothetical protein GCM10007856_02750 [Azospirillum oryzae]